MSTLCHSLSRDFRSAKRDLRKVVGNRSSSVNSANVSREKLNRFKKETDLCFLVFMEKGEKSLKEKGECDETDDIKETKEDIVQNYQSLVSEFNSLSSSFGLKEIKIALDNQNQSIFAFRRVFSFYSKFKEAC